MSGTTPLLLLLNELLSHDDHDREQQEAGIRSALQALDAMVNGELPPYSLPMTSRELVRILAKVLEVHPQLARKASAHEGSLPLHFAASLGDVNVASLLLDYYPEAAARPNDKGKIPLHYAAREGRLHMVRLFMKVAPYTAAIKSKKDKLALHFAAGEGHVEIVQSLLSAYPKGASIPSAKGKVPLHFAARWGHMHIALDLLHFYPNGIKTLDWEGSLPLHDAAREGQFPMSEFLVQRFPEALAAANLRGDIPLFPAVRSENIELVAFLVQVWPEGGRHVLQSIRSEDCVSEWDQDAFTLVLRGAVDNFDGCELLQGRNAPNIRLKSELNAVNVIQPPDEDTEHDEMMVTDGTGGMDVKEQTISVACSEMKGTQPLLQEDQSEAVAVCSTISRKRQGKDKSRSKSPVLQTDEQESHEEDQKRKRRCTVRPGSTCSSHKPRTFLPLHAALESNASQPVVEHVLEYTQRTGTTCSLDVKDHEGRYALHCAMNWAKNDVDRCAFVIQNMVQTRPQVASFRDASGIFPLWQGIRANVHADLISALIAAHPPAAVSDVRKELRPVEMACHCSCDLSTVYQLLREDPSHVETMVNRRNDQWTPAFLFPPVESARFRPTGYE